MCLEVESTPVPTRPPKSLSDLRGAEGGEREGLPWKRVGVGTATGGDGQLLYLRGKVARLFLRFIGG